MERKKLSLRLQDTDGTDDSATISDEVAAARSLIEAHGQRAGQVLVDEAQAAIKAGDDDRVLFLDRVRIAMSVMDEALPAKRHQ